MKDKIFKFDSSILIMPKLVEVYGNSRGIPLTYEARVSVDERFVNDLTREKHIILHGGSKQGKTTLRKSILKEEECVIVQCTRDTTRSSIYEMILKKAEIEYEVSSSLTTKGTHKLSVKISGEGKIPLIAKAAAEGAGEYNHEKEKSYE
jgi:acetylglutamate kinase